ncbi:MAG: error-prone DNA polymerase [Phycisphaerales bacterium]|nr:error-prone DNA polymerase [Phycisphaerales bacterium]
MPELPIKKMREHPGRHERHKEAPAAFPPSHAPPYAELHVTTNFSFLRGASHPDEIVDRAAALGYEAVAITDVNTLAGIVRAHVAAKEAGIRLVVGCRVELRSAGSLLLFPTDRASYARLSRLLTLGKRRAAKGKCHLTAEDVIEHQAGMLGVIVPGDDPADASHLSRLRGAFDDDRLSIAAACLYGPDDAVRLLRLHALSVQAGIPLVATNDVHYHEPGRRALQDVVTCIRHGTTLDRAGYRLFAGGERYLKGPAEMSRLFSGFAWGPGAVARSVQIARRAAFSLDELRYEYPEEVVPEGHTPMSWLRELTRRGARERYAEKAEAAPGCRREPGHEEPDGHGTPVRCPGAPLSAAPQSPPARPLPPGLLARLDEEFTLIESLGYAKYFLTVHDIVQFARAQGILCQGRGAAANSAVCYCLGITSVDPSRIDLLFERFVSKERNEPPDIDIDFEHERREEVIQYIYTRFGRRRAALTAEVISYRGRSAVRDVGKALGLSLDLVDRMAKQLDWWDDGVITPARARELGIDAADPTIGLLLTLTGQLLGFPRHLSQHVGGFVITQEPLDELVPVENAAMEDRTVIEWDKDDIDAMGMLKIDVLGLGMLTAIRRVFDLVLPRRLALHTIPPEDPAVYEMIQAADTVGVFQIESRAQMAMLPRLRPACYYDLVIEVAIVRPGPIQGDMVHPYLRRRQGLEPAEYPSEEVRRVLGRTLGVPLFQEQAMRLAIVAAGFTAGEADQLRRAMAAWKRKGDRLLKFEDRFIRGMLDKGYAEEFARRCFEQLKGFSEYGFPESHAASFALLVYVSAWLKRHHPAAFAAALVNSQPMGFYAPAQIVRDAQEHGVTVREVDVNASGWDCSLEGNMAEDQSTRALRLGMRLVKGLSRPHADAIAAAVKGHGPFRTVDGLWRASGVPATALRRLARADGFRSMGLDRRQALWQVRDLRDAEMPLYETGGCGETPGHGRSTDAESGRTAGTSSLGDPALPRLPPLSQSRHVVQDYATTGLSLRAHPASFLRRDLTRRRIEPCRALKDEGAWPTGTPIAVAGVVLCRQRPGTASGVVFITLEDETGIANLIVRPHIYQRFRRDARHGVMVAAWGRVERQGQVVHVLVTRVQDLARTGAAPADLPVSSRDFH